MQRSVTCKGPRWPMLSEYRRLDQLHLPRAEEQSTAPYGMEFKPTLNLYRSRQQIIDKAKMPTIKGLSIGLHSVPVHAIVTWTECCGTASKKSVQIPVK